MRFKPVNRRWNLIGMVLGAGLGALPAALPEPIQNPVNWIAIGSLMGFMLPAYSLLHGHWNELRDSKLVWSASISFALIGSLVGAFLWYIGKQLEPGMGLSATCTHGFFAGFMIVDLYFRRIDARNREEESLWERSEDA